MTSKLKHPWMVAVWPGMGHVAISAGYYLMAKMGMHLFAEYPSDELFDVENVEVKDGLITPARLPRNRFFSWSDPNGVRDIVLFIGESQPPLGKHLFCTNLMEFAVSFGVERIFTFAAMATNMRPENPSRVFCAATDDEVLKRLQEAKLYTVDDGHISGLNGILIGTAAEKGVPGACLLGEMPHVFTQLPYPKASLGVLRAFAKLADLQLDLDELAQQAEVADEQLATLLAKMEAAIAQSESSEEEDEESFQNELFQDDRLSSEDESRIEALFELAREDRSRAYELKRELDRLDVFADYEDRFLDLFKKQE